MKRVLLIGAVVIALGAVTAVALFFAFSKGQDGGRPPPGPYLVCVSNEVSGDVTVIGGADGKVLATIPVGKRPRGIHASPDGRLLYVALSGSPLTGPPKLDGKGVPIQKDDEDNADRAADGIGVIDLREMKFLRKLPAGSDPEEFAVSADGERLYVSNEDVGTLSVVRAEDGTVETIVRVKKEPEGVALTPDAKHVYVTCETGGEVVVIDAASNKAVAEFVVGGRPRTVAFSPDGSRAFIPSETAGTVSVFETAGHTLLQKIALPAGSRPMGTAMGRGGKKLYVSTGRAGTVCVLDPAAGKVLATVAVGKRPWGLALSPDGGRLYVANGPSGDISVIDLATDEEAGRIEVGKGPWGVAVVPDPR